MMDIMNRPNPVVVVVEDDPLLLNDLVEELELSGYIAIGHKNGSDAMSFLSANTVDLVLCDINMPVMDGRQLLKALRKADIPAKDVPFIYLTTQSSKDEILDGYESGADDYIIKPIDYNILLSKISATIMRSIRKEEAHQIELQNMQFEIDNIKTDLFREIHLSRITNLPTETYFSTILNTQLRSLDMQLNDSVLIGIYPNSIEYLRKNVTNSDTDGFLSELGNRLLSWRDYYVVDRGACEILFGFSEAKFIFYIFIPGVFSDDLMNEICLEICQNLEEPVIVEDKQYQTSFSMGVSYKTATITSASEFMTNTEMSLVKDEFLNFHSRECAENKLRTENFIGKIFEAIENNQFFLEYQPKIDVKTSRIMGAEALIRWKQKDGRIIQPDDFIPLINKPDYMIPVTTWVLKECCRQIAEWNLKGISISLNIPPFCLEDKSFAKIVDIALGLSPIDPHLLEFELLETSIINDTGMFIANILSIQNLGVNLSLDDFGSGYSNYDYLSNISFKSLKIDRSLIFDIENDLQKKTVVESMVLLSKKLGIMSVAEGVETKSCLDVLKTLGCDQYQGYYKYRPLPPDDFINLVR